MLQTTAQGLTSEEARQRLDRYGPNLVKPKKRYDFITLLWAQFKSPIILILAFAAVLSFFLHDQSTAIIVLVIIIVSGLLGFWQEYGAMNAVKKLVSLVQVKATVLRDGNSVELPIENIVPGDIVILRAGDVIPGDCFLLESQDLFADEAVLTGETYPVEKAAGMLQADISLKERRNTLFMGTHVISGSARAVA